MTDVKSTNQKTYTQVWNHFIRDGKPFQVHTVSKTVELAFVVNGNEPLQTTNNYIDKEKSFPQVTRLTRNSVFGEYRTDPFLTKLAQIHNNIVIKMFSKVDLFRNTNVYARKFTREFRKNYKIELLSIARKENLEVPTYYALTYAAKRSAKRYKK